MGNIVSRRSFSNHIVPEISDDKRSHKNVNEPGDAPSYYTNLQITHIDFINANETWKLITNGKGNKYQKNM